MSARKSKACTSGCRTKDHKTWGECMRSKNLRVAPNLSETNVQRAWDKELNSYESAVRQGVQPSGTKQHQIDAAMKEAEASA